MRWKLHVRFGGRAGETHPMRVEQGAPVRPLHLCDDQDRDGLRLLHHRCLLTDDRRVAGGGPLRTDMVLDALEMARHSRRAGRLVGLVTHSDAGSQFTSVRFTERLDEIGATPSIGTVADSFDNALAEAINGLYKTECVYGPDTCGWDDVSHLELATLSWVHWFNEERLHGYCGDIPPAEFEAAFYAGNDPVLPGLGNQ